MQSTYIYIMDCPMFDYKGIKTVQIGASNNPMNLREDFQTALLVKLKVVRIFKILNCTAYDVNEFLKTINSLNIDVEIKHYKLDGGDEHYILPNLNDIEKIFTMFNIKYKLITDYTIFKDKKEHIRKIGNATKIKQLSEEKLERK